MNTELLEKYCNNCCSEEELKSVLAWFEESGGTSEGRSLLFKVWLELPDKAGIYNTDFELLLGRIHHEINLSGSKKLLEISGQNPAKYKRRVRFINILTRVAAILLFPVLVIGIYMSIKYNSAKTDLVLGNQSFNEVFSSVDAITKVTLPDGSNVWLNHSSSLKYPAMFDLNSRIVELNGEGYFEIIGNTKKPFIVSAGEIQVRAIGTAFNIMAYPDEDRIETSLINGQVELQLIKPDGKAFHLLSMKPTDLAVFQKSNNEVSTFAISDDRYFSWKNGKLVFDKEPLDVVVKKLSRWFNVDIQIKDHELLELTYTATFVHETLPQVLELLTLMSPVSYSVSKRQEISPGTFTKRKIILSYRDK